AQSPEVLPPPPPDLPSVGGLDANPTAATGKTALPPAIRMWCGYVKLTDYPAEWPAVYAMGFVRTNAREGEDPVLRHAGTTPALPGVPAHAYDPAYVDSGSQSSLVAPGGLEEVVWVAVFEDPVPEHRKGPPAPDSTWSRNVL